MPIQQLLVSCANEISRLQSGEVTYDDANIRLRGHIAAYCSTNMPDNSPAQIMALLPANMVSIFDCDPSGFDPRSMFFYDGDDAQIIFAIQLLYQIIRQGTYDLADTNTKLAYLPLIKRLSTGTNFEHLECEGCTYSYLFHPESTPNFNAAIIETRRNYAAKRMVETDGTLESIASQFRGLSVNSLHNYRPYVRGANIVPPYVGAETLLSDLRYVEEFNPTVAIKVDQLLGQNPRPVAGDIQLNNIIIKKIRGDGNCYYRAVMYKMLQDIALSTGAERETLIDNFSVQIEKVGSMIEAASPAKWANFVRRADRQPSKEEAIIKHNNLLAFLDGARRGEYCNSVNELDEALSSADLDYAVGTAARFLVADEIIKRQNEQFNELSLSDAILLNYGVGSDLPEPCENLDEFIKRYVLQDNTCAEGAPVNLGLLPLLFGYDCFLTNLPYGRGSNISLVDAHANQGKEIRILLRPGHYDALYSREHFAKINAQRENFYRSRPPAIQPMAPAQQPFVAPSFAGAPSSSSQGVLPEAPEAVLTYAEHLNRLKTQPEQYFQTVSAQSVVDMYFALSNQQQEAFKSALTPLLINASEIQSSPRTVALRSDLNAVLGDEFISAIPSAAARAPVVSSSAPSSSSQDVLLEVPASAPSSSFSSSNAKQKRATRKVRPSVANAPAPSSSNQEAVTEEHAPSQSSFVVEEPVVSNSAPSSSNQDVLPEAPTPVPSFSALSSNDVSTPEPRRVAPTAPPAVVAPVVASAPVGASASTRVREPREYSGSSRNQLEEKPALSSSAAQEPTRSAPVPARAPEMEYSAHSSNSRQATPPVARENERLSVEGRYVGELQALKQMIRGIDAAGLLKAQQKALSEARDLVDVLDKQTPEESDYSKLAEICSITTQGLRFVVQEKAKPFQCDIFFEGEAKNISYNLDTHKKNMEHLSELACTLKGHGWKTTRNILFGLAIALVVACAVVAAIPTGGVGLVVGLGAAAALAAGAGLFVGSNTGFAKTVASIKMKQDLFEVKQDGLENQTPTNPGQIRP